MSESGGGLDQRRPAQTSASTEESSVVRLLFDQRALAMPDE